MDIPFPFSSSQYYYLVFFFLFLLILLTNELKKSRAQLKLPPGPWKLPILGNLHQLVGSLPHHALKTLAQKHGPLMHIKLGEIQAIVVSSPRIAKEVTKTNDLAFADRVELMLPKIVMYNSTDIASTPYGEYWKQMRKIWVLEFLGQRKVRSFHNLMEDEVLHVVNSIRLISNLSQINLTEKILSIECGIICKATIGRVCKDQNSLVMIIKEAVKIAGVFNFADVFPTMKFFHFLSAGSRRKLEKMREKVDFILEDIIQQHEKKRALISENGETMEEEDMLDVFLRLSESKDLQVPITRDNIKANIFEMFIVGIETSSIVIEWAMSEMMRNPRVMHKAQSEVRQALYGKERFLQTDIQNLKYLKLIIKETLRLHPPGPLLCPRRCRLQSKIDGYDIPVNTVVLTNVWAIGRDPESWKNPEKFKPERFEDAEIDFSGNHFEFIPFGAGRRICPGIGFGLAGVELTFAHLLYHFDWKIPGGIDPKKFDMTENFGASTGRKNNLCLIAKFYDPNKLLSVF